MNRRAYLKAAAMAEMSPLRAPSNPTGFPAIIMTNHTYKVAPGCLYPYPDVNSLTFGVIGSARSGRITQFGTKLIF